MIKRFVASVGLFLAVSASSFAADRTPSIVLLEVNPWGMVIGSDSPSFAMYSDGSVIFYDFASRQFMTVKLSTNDRETLSAKLSSKALKTAAGSYSIFNGTDQTSNFLYAWDGDTRSEISIYGNLRLAVAGLPKGKKYLGGDIEFVEGMQRKFREEVPSVARAAFETIFAFAPPAEPWVPDQVEVIVWPFEHSKEPPLAWPKEWPGLSTSVKRGDRHSIYLPGEQLDELRAFFQSRNAKQAVLLDGKKWAISMRFPFPGEEQWMRK